MTNPPADAPPLLEVENLRKSFTAAGRTLEVLKGVSVAVRPGEAVAVVGPSGAGKSTLLHLMGCLDSPTEGSVRLRGEELGRLGEGAKARVRNERFGFVFQMYHLLADLTALENVLLPFYIRHRPGSWLGARAGVRKKGTELLVRLGLGERLRHRPSQLSGGERQRVAIARALVNDPEVVFCDEPTGNLDAATAREIQEILLGLNRETGRTLVIVTHDEEFAGRAHRTVRLRDGLVQ